METDAAFVRADGIVELYAIADIVLNLALVVDPGHTEGDDAVRLDHALDDFCFFKFRMLVVDVLDADEDFLDCLKIFLFTRVFGLQVAQNGVNVHDKKDLWLVC